MQFKQKNVLQLAILAALSAGSLGANATQVTVTGATYAAAKLASELPVGGFTTAATAAREFTGVQTVTTFAPSAGQSLQIHITLNNGAKYVGAPTIKCANSAAASAGTAGVQATLNLGGAGADSGVWTLDAGTVSTFYSAGSAIYTCMVSATGITVTGAHADVTQSVTYTYGTLSSGTQSDVLMTFGSGLSAGTTVGADVVALVTAQFTSASANSGGNVINAGTISWNGGNGYLSAGLAAMDLNLVLGATSGTVTVDGAALAAAKTTAGVWLATAATNCAASTAGAGLATAAVNGTSITFTGLDPTNLSAGVVVCMQMNGTTAIPAGSITATLGGTAVATYTLPTDTAHTMMNITRNGTTLVAPLVNFPSGWISRMVLVNRGTADAAYTVTATSESGNTVTLTGAASSGTIAAGTTDVVDLSGLATATGSARTSFYVTISGAQTNVDGLVQLVNASTGNLSNYTMIQK